MIKIEIYERKTKKVLETLEFESMEDFRFYWRHQCDATNYGYREVKKKERAKK